MKVDDAIFRLGHLQRETDGKCLLSFSGGKDSTVLANIYVNALKEGKLKPMPIVFSDTGLEYESIYRFVKWFSENVHEVETIKPSVPFSKIIREYGKPAMSKSKSSFINTYQRALKKNQDPLKLKRTSELILGFRTDKKTFKPVYREDGVAFKTPNRLANKHFNFLHPDHEYKIANKCCVFLKKKPFEDYYMSHDILGYATGMRVSEGGIRAMVYKSCTSYKKVGGISLLHKLPIFDWEDSDIDNYINKYDIKIADAYTEYGLDRTWCTGCPYAKDIGSNLKVLYEHEPKRYKAMQIWLGDVYRDLGVKLDFDPEYMEKYRERLPVVEKRRNEMLNKYRPKVNKEKNGEGEESD